MNYFLFIQRPVRPLGNLNFTANMKKTTAEKKDLCVFNESNNH